MSEATVRAKFYVTHHTHQTFSNNHKGNVQVHLEARGDSSLPEDKRFHEATPNGHIDLTITNQSAIDKLAPGKVFYLDFIEVEGLSPNHT